MHGQTMQVNTIRGSAVMPTALCIQTPLVHQRARRPQLPSPCLHVVLARLLCVYHSRTSHPRRARLLCTPRSLLQRLVSSRTVLSGAFTTIFARVDTVIHLILPCWCHGHTACRSGKSNTTRLLCFCARYSCSRRTTCVRERCITTREPMRHGTRDRLVNRLCGCDSFRIVPVCSDATGRVKNVRAIHEAICCFTDNVAQLEQIKHSVLMPLRRLQKSRDLSLRLLGNAGERSACGSKFRRLRCFLRLWAYHRCFHCTTKSQVQIKGRLME